MENQTECVQIEKSYSLDFSDKQLIIHDSSADDEECPEINFTKSFRDTMKLVNNKRKDTWLLTHRPLWDSTYLTNSMLDFKCSSNNNLKIKHKSLHILFDDLSNVKDLMAKYNISLHSHMHLFEEVEFKDKRYPANIIIGNSGVRVQLYSPFHVNWDQRTILKKGMIWYNYGYITLNKDEFEWSYTLKVFKEIK